MIPRRWGDLLGKCCCGARLAIYAKGQIPSRGRLSLHKPRQPDAEGLRNIVLSFHKITCAKAGLIRLLDAELDVIELTVGRSGERSVALTNS